MTTKHPDEQKKQGIRVVNYAEPNTDYGTFETLEEALERAKELSDDGPRSILYRTNEEGNHVPTQVWWKRKNDPWVYPEKD